MFAEHPRVVTAIASIISCAHFASAQHVIETAEGRAEVIGLNRWTPTMLADSLGLHDPGVSLFQTKECTKALIDHLHFRSVSIDKVILAGRDGQPALSVVIRIVEPDDSARIVWRAEPRDSQPVRSEWSGLVRILTNSAGTFREGELVNPLALYGRYLVAGPDSAGSLAVILGLDSANAERFWGTLKLYKRPIDLRVALQALATDGSRRNRMIAAAVLVNFPNEDRAWRALAEALRDPYPGVNVTARQSLEVLRKQFARHVDWTPSVGALRALIDGTNVSAFMTLIRVLSQTSVSSSLAAPLLRNGGSLLVAHAGASDQPSHIAGDALLRQLSGRAKPADGWLSWIAML